MITFATNVWENDWRHVLLDPTYLSVKQIANHLYPFAEKVLIINNVDDLEAVKQAAQKLINIGVLTRYVVAQDVLPFFDLKRADFDSWKYYNALGPLNAIYFCQTPYLLFMTGDSYLKGPVQWIGKTLRFMDKDPMVKVANCTWNDNYREAKKESVRETWNFYVAEKGFSDQMFLIRKDDFKGPIYGQIRSEGDHFPWGDTWEKRVFSYMLNHKWKRITYKWGSYTHENIVKETV